MVAAAESMTSVSSEPRTGLFSYGTLQREAVQRRQFGRRLEGVPDAIPGYRTEQAEIFDEAVVALSGLRFHPNLVATGDPADEVGGTLYFLTADELEAADAYEVAPYRRILVPLKSGRNAWVYAKG